jgi:nucleotide-binding universal stress UspA family protein
MNPQITPVILCPTDFSEPAAHAMRWAGELARRLGARLIALYADRFLPPPHFTAGQIDSLLEELNRSRQAARDTLADTVRRLVPPDVNTELLVEEEMAVPVIVRVAHERQADLVVMGSHGHSGFERIMLGSVTEKVLRLTDRPVLVVKGAAGGASAVPGIRGILCPVDLTDASREALQLAAELAGKFNAALQVLHVIADEGAADPAEDHRRLCEWVPGAARVHCEIQELVRSGDAAEQILSAVQGNDLVVLATRHKIFWDATVLGATAARIVRHAPCPVLIVPVS